jgi:8-oxo-dGTP diphosphatase
MSEALPRIGVGVIVWRGDKFLLGRRLSGPGAGTWQLPGGRLEPNEGILSCARREVHEETGVEITDLQPGPWTEDRFEASGLRYLTVFVHARHAGGEPRALEPRKAAQWGWFSPQALPAPLFTPLQSLLRLDHHLLRPMPERDFQSRS